MAASSSAYGSAAVTGSSSSLSNDLPNGTYTWTAASVAGYSPSPPSGTFKITGSAASPVPVVYSRVFTSVEAYTVSASASGLSVGDSWRFAAGGTSSSGTASTLHLSLPSGSYTWAVTPPPGYTATPASGSVVVAGSAVSVGTVVLTVTYPTTATFAVTEIPSGLPAGGSWSLSIGGTSTAGIASSLSLSLPNGSYTWAASPPGGYSASPAGGIVSVNGAPITLPTVTITASPIVVEPTPVTVNPTPLRWPLPPAGTLAGIEFAAAFVLLILAASAYSGGKKGARSALIRKPPG